MPPQQPIQLGRRIVVWGVTGSGKTTLARHLAGLYSLQRIELDALYWNKGWVGTPDDEFRSKVNQALATAADGWVLDGSYHRVSDLYLPPADTLIWLHLPWRSSFWRLLKRSLARAWTREPLYFEDGPRESWRMLLLDSDSILRYSITGHREATRRRRDRIATLPPHIRLYELRSPREVNALLATLLPLTDRQT